MADAIPTDDADDIVNKINKKRKGSKPLPKALESSEPLPMPMPVDSLGIQPVPRPVPFDPSAYPKGTFIDEPWDRLLPGPGFFRDFTYALKGTETNTGFSMWAAIWAISTILTRDAWLTWYPDPLYPNIYVLFVSLPGTKKSTAALFAGKVTRRVSEYFEKHNSPLMAFKKKVEFLMEKASTESLDLFLEPESKYFNISREGRVVTVPIKKPSLLNICSDELTTLLQNATYAAGIVDRLVKLYDCMDGLPSISATKSEGKKSFDKTYTTLIAATTPDSMRLTMPPTASGGGFLSRLIIVCSDTLPRVFPRPTHIPGTPTVEDLTARLAWIAENCAGEYVFSPEADAFFDEWYTSWKVIAFQNGTLTNENARLDTHIRKIAMIVRIQRYEPGNIITLEDVKVARRILNYTLEFSKHVTEDTASDQIRFTNRIRTLIQRRGSIQRLLLVRKMGSQKCPAAMVDSALWQLLQEEVISISTAEGVAISNVTSKGSDVYTWIGPEEAEPEGDNDDHEA